MTNTIFVQGEPSGAALGASVYDNYCRGLDSGEAFLWDGAHPDGFPLQSDPANGSLIFNLLGDGADGDVVLTGSSTLDFAQQGFKVETAIAAGEVPVGVRAPASILSNIWGAGAGLQHFLMFGYVRLPTAAQWPTQAGSVNGFVSPVTINPGVTYGTDPFPGLLAFDVTGGGARQVSFRRRLDSGSTFDTLAISAGIPTDGPIAQIAGWRNASGRGLRIKTQSIELIATGAAGAASTFDFSARQMVWGVAGGLAQTSPAHTPAWRIYRGGIENLEASGRDPVTVLDADWQRFASRLARGFYS
jgi:hypothetical protein